MKKHLRLATAAFAATTLVLAGCSSEDSGTEDTTTTTDGAGTTDTGTTDTGTTDTGTTDTGTDAGTEETEAES